MMICCEEAGKHHLRQHIMRSGRVDRSKGTTSTTSVVLVYPMSCRDSLALDD